MNEEFIGMLHEHSEVFAKLGSMQTLVERVAEAVCVSLKKGGKLMLCGNGGSASDSQHIAAEFVGRFVHDRKPLAAIALTTDTSAMTAIGNDYSFNDVFVRQVTALGRAGDVLLGISTSGNSENVRKAVAEARSRGMVTVGLLGKDGGKLKDEVDIALVVPCTTTARVQEAHIFLGHALCALVEAQLRREGEI